MRSITKIGIFCGANSGYSSIYSEAAETLADQLASMGISLVYGGAKVGLMGTLANRMIQRGAAVIGIIPKSLFDVEIAHEGLTELHIVNSMHERKALISDLSDGFIMLPGGAGSLDEFFEMFTWGQLGMHSKPCGILNVESYFDDLLKFLDKAVSQGFLKQVHKEMIIVDHSVSSLMDKFNNYEPPAAKKWINTSVC
ncbi:MAG: TIGR00730 family Rossman fold protein [Tatlockia sp.]|nr:TIGR00730 family Rossman fold protein [Tatlockia sp.]